MILLIVKKLQPIENWTVTVPSRSYLSDICYFVLLYRRFCWKTLNILISRKRKWSGHFSVVQSLQTAGHSICPSAPVDSDSFLLHALGSDASTRRGASVDDDLYFMLCVCVCVDVCLSAYVYSVCVCEISLLFFLWCVGVRECV